MRKQYDIYECPSFCYNIVLYHDGMKVGVEKKSVLDCDEYVDELESRGYTRGNTKEDIENARQRYEFLYENRIGEANDL